MHESLFEMLHTTLDFSNKYYEVQFWLEIDAVNMMMQVKLLVETKANFFKPLISLSLLNLGNLLLVL